MDVRMFVSNVCGASLLRTLESRILHLKWLVSLVFIRMARMMLLW